MENRGFASHLRLLTALFALLLGLSTARSARATVGAMAISTDVTLTADHSGQIRFDADNITLDCAGHRILYAIAYSTGCGSAGTLRCGVLAANRSGITIKDCDVVGAYNYGMWIAGTSASTVLDSSTSGAVVGFRVEDATGITFSNSAAVSNGAGFEIRDSADIVLTETDAVYSSGDGFDINDSTGTRIRFGAALLNGVNGIEFDDSPSSSVSNSEALYNGQHGVSLDNSTEPRVSRNTIQGNFEDGLRLQNCDNGTIRYNQADGNGVCNANQDGASFGNTWTGNTLQNWCGTVPNSH